MPKQRSAQPKPIIPPPPAPLPSAKGGFRYHTIGQMVTERRYGEAQAAVREALVKANGNVSQFARDVNASYQTVRRWINTLKTAGYSPLS